MHPYLSIREREEPTSNTYHFEYQLLGSLNLFRPNRPRNPERFCFDLFNMMKHDGTLLPDTGAIKITIRDALATVESHFNLLKKTLRHECTLQFTDEQKQYIEHQFPIVFILEDDQESPDKKLQPLKYEFRSKQALRLGKDITQLATTTENIEKLKLFCRAYPELSNVKVIDVTTLSPQKTVTSTTHSSALFPATSPSQQTGSHRRTSFTHKKG